MNWVLFVLFIYVLCQLGIGVWVARRLKTEDDYFVAGRRLGFFMVMMTVFATWFGSETCLGSSGAMYADGISGGRADPFGYGLCILLMGVFFAAAFWRKKVTTLSDIFRMRFGVRAEKLAAVMLVPPSVLWAAAQVRAFGQVLSAASSAQLEITMIVAAVIVISYTVMGGLMADAITDVIQGSVLVLGLFILFVVVVTQHVDAEAVQATFTAERLSFFSQDRSWLDTLETWAIPIMGSLFAQELLARTLAAKSARTAQRATITAACLYLLIGLMPATLGLLGPALLPGLEGHEQEQLLPLLAQKYLPVVLYTMFVGALISAILSTVDSALLAAGALTAHNLIGPLRPQATERQKIFVARSCVVVFGITAYILARGSEGIYDLVYEASAFGSAPIFVCVLFAMKSRIGGPVTAIATLIAGLTSYVLMAHVIALDHPYVLSVAVSAVVYCATAYFEGPQRGIDDEVTA